MRRIVCSLLALPIAVIALAAMYGVLSAPSGGVLEAIGNFRYQALWYALVAYVAIGVLAAPALLVAWRKRWLRWWHSVLLVLSLERSPSFQSLLLRSSTNGCALAIALNNWQSFESSRQLVQSTVCYSGYLLSGAIALHIYPAKRAQAADPRARPNPSFKRTGLRPAA